jgi:hypothetical protein
MTEVRTGLALVTLLASCLFGCPGSDLCAVECPMPPTGCHYESSNADGACDEVSCGKVVCSQENSSESSDAGADQDGG